MAEVFYADLHCDDNENLLKKLRRLIVRAGLTKIDLEGKFTAIKIHFGEPGNLAYLRPNWARVVVDVVKEQGGKPFLTDCNTLYVGRRKDALEHLEVAYENGFSPFSTGCHVVIADGLKGTDEIRVPIDGELVREAKIGRAVVDADVIVSLNHFKGHESTGIGGAIKNLGMGCGSRAGKLEMHASGQTAVDPDKCVGCGTCLRNCAFGAIAVANGKAVIDLHKCAGCSRCLGECPTDAIYGVNYNRNDVLCKKMAEYAAAVLKGKPHFHISLITDVSPCCDCHNSNDVPIVPNLGMLASFDPVALDCACADLVNAAPANPGSVLKGTETDHFHELFEDTDWKICLHHAEKMGMGTCDYTLIKI